MKICLTVLLLLLGSALPSPIYDELPNGDVMYPFGVAEGDRKTPKDDDGTSPEITSKEPFEYFGKNHTSFYVNNNGVVSFDEPVSAYTPKGIPLTDGKAFVAPYWGDVNNQIHGDIFYRQTKDPATLDPMNKDINKYFPGNDFKGTWALIATWYQVAYFGSVSKKTNTFQCVLITGGKDSYVILNYGDIQWTTGTASGGNRKTGLGGTPAQAGFNTGDNKNYYSIPGSRSPHILNIINTSNVEVPGRWAFKADNFTVTGVSEELQKLIPVVEEEPEAPVQEEPQAHVEEPQTHVEEPQTHIEEPQSPVVEPQIPIEEPPAPVEEPPAPVEETPAPVEEPPAPVEEIPAPVKETSASVEETLTSVEETNASVEETKASVEETKASVEETKASVEETPASVEETLASVEKTSASVEEETEDSLEDYYYYYDDEDCEW